MSHQANDAAAQSSSRDLPLSRPAPRPSTASIAVTSPTKPLTSSARPERSPAITRPQLHKPRISDDEKRLVGDFSTPADAVAVPNPMTWFVKTTDTSRPMMNKKPGSNSSFHPINTISDVNTRPGRSKVVTYGKHHRPYLPPIGLAQHPGQVGFLERQQSRAPTTPARNTVSRDEHARRSGGAPSAKRRKTEHVIDVDSDDDVQVVLPPFAPHTPARASYGLPPAAKSAQSYVSSGSGTTSKQQPQSQSGFERTDGLVNPRRKKARTPGSNNSQGRQQISPFGGGSMSGSVKTHTPNAPIYVFDDEVADRTKSARQIILEDCRQGQSALSSEDRRPSSHNHDALKAPFFPNARINESTSEAHEQSASNPRAISESTDLRNRYRRVPSNPVEIGDSEDELAGPDANEQAHKRVKTISKARQAANSGVKRQAQSKAQSKEASKGWPLVYARTHGYEVHGSEMDRGRYNLMLRSDSDGWRVTAYEKTEGIFQTKIEIKSDYVNNVQADDISRIRLQGPRQQDGIVHVFDLEFAKTSDLQLFRDKHAVSLTVSGKVLTKFDNTIPALFSKPLPTNDKVGTSLLVHDEAPEANSHNEQTKNTSKTPLWDQFKRATEGSNIHAESMEKNGFTTTTTTSRTRDRASRSTKPSAPTYAPVETVDHRKVGKFSIDEGLGTPWTKPLEYGQGRQRAVVHFDDLPRLDEEEFMNDSLIDFYMIYLSKKLNVPSDKVYFFNTYFFTQLTKNTGRQSMNYKAVERWTSKIDIFSYDYIVVPINEATHWYLAIICNMSQIVRKAVVEDFDDNIVAESVEGRRDLPNQAANETAEVTEPVRYLQPVDAEDRNEQSDDDPNLFEEESNLNLVDGDDMGTEKMSGPEDDQTLSVSHPLTANTSQATRVASGANPMPKGILSNLTASPKKKKAKRRPTQAKKDPNQPIIVILDSLGQTRSGTVRALKDWLAAEGKAKRGMEVVIKENGYYPKASQIPMQNNWTDCGVYLLGYVEKFFQNPDEFKNKLLTAEMSAEEDWPELKPKDMRKEMRDIILRCAEEQDLARKAEKKAKRGVVKAKPIPVPGKEVLSKPAPKPLQSDRPLPDRPGSGETEQSHTESVKLEQPGPNMQPPIAVSTPRLASPITFKSQTAESAARPQSPQAVGKISDSPPVATPAKPASTTPRMEQTPRRRSPEVRIPVQSPRSHKSARSGQTMLTTAGPYDGKHQQGSPRLSSPSKRPRREGDDGQARIPGSIRSPHQQGHRIERSIPRVSRSREGSAPHIPIQIEDSQDLESMLVKSPEHAQVGSPAKHRHPTRSPRFMQTLRPSMSIEEIAPPSPRAVERKHRQPEGESTGDELKPKPNDSDFDRKRSRHAGAQSPTAFAPHASLERVGEVASQPIDVGSHNAEAMDIDSPRGSVVGETPEPDNRNPVIQEGWTRGDVLPL